jgi:2-polyprenyl-3-methyl-5-hydroxy-6-metoxy-1,4-benzoquinol methylase
MQELDTDKDWEFFGRTDPYWGVLTHAQFKSENLTDAARAEFFDSGRANIQHILGVVRDKVVPGFVPGRALDFGCGVGRLTLPLAEVAHSVVGVDVSDSMLAEARRNASAGGLANVEFVKADDRLSQVDGPFDFVNTYIVLQHIPAPRGQAIFQRLVELLAPGGVGAVHVTYSKPMFDACPAYFWPASSPFLAATVAEMVKPLWRALPWVRRAAKQRKAESGPLVNMFSYTLNPLFHLLQHSGVRRLHVEFTNHGADYGAFLFFQKSDDGYRF